MVASVMQNNNNPFFYGKNRIVFCKPIFFAQYSHKFLKIQSRKRFFYKLKQLIMKTIFNFKLLLALPFIFTATSCLKSDDPEFNTIGSGYIIQEVEDREGEIISQFFPIINIVSLSANHLITSCSCTGPVLIGSISMTKVHDYNWVSRNTESIASTTPPIGTYSYIARNSEGEEQAGSFTLSVSKTMGGKLEGSIEYNADSKMITAMFNKVENANAYLICIESTSLENIIYYNFNPIPEATLEANDWKVSQSLPTSYFEAGTYRIYTAALIMNNSSIMEILQKGASTPPISIQ